MLVSRTIVLPSPDGLIKVDDVRGWISMRP
jgi:hypothetical protein